MAWENRLLLPFFLAYVHPATRIPLIATLLASLAILILALWFPVVKLAEITSFAILIVFALVNLALAATSSGIPRKIVPTTGFILCLLLLASRFLI